MGLQYDILELISHNENGMTLNEICIAMPNIEKREIAKSLGENEITSFIRGDWIKNKENRWERKYFIAYDIPDGIFKLRLMKSKNQKP
jgi:hypothetical protein